MIYNVSHNSRQGRHGFDFHGGTAREFERIYIIGEIFVLRPVALESIPCLTVALIEP